MNYLGWVQAALVNWAAKANELDDVTDSEGKLIIGPRRVQIGRKDDVIYLVLDGKLGAKVRVEVVE